MIYHAVNMVAISGGLINDCRLSSRARFIMIYLSSKYDNWEIRVDDLMRVSKESEYIVKRCIKELVHYDYLKLSPEEELEYSTIPDLDLLSPISDSIEIEDKFKSLVCFINKTPLFIEKLKKMSYKSFLFHWYWIVVSEYVKFKHNYKCDRCSNTEHLHTHHTTYEHHGEEHLYWETDLIVLCKDCHKTEHDN